MICFDDYQKSGDTHFFAYRSTRFFLHLKEQVKYYQNQWYLADSHQLKNCTAPRGVLPFSNVFFDAKFHWTWIKLKPYQKYFPHFSFFVNSHSLCRLHKYFLELRCFSVKMRKNVWFFFWKMSVSSWSFYVYNKWDKWLEDKKNKNDS